MLTDKTRIKLSYAKHSLRHNYIIEHLIEHIFLPWSQDNVIGKVNIIKVSSPGYPLSQTPVRTWERQLEVEEEQVHVTLILSPWVHVQRHAVRCQSSRASLNRQQCRWIAQGEERMATSFSCFFHWQYMLWERRMSVGGFSSFHQSVTAPSPSNGAADMPEMLKSLRCRGAEYE